LFVDGWLPFLQIVSLILVYSFQLNLFTSLDAFDYSKLTKKFFYFFNELHQTVLMDSIKPTSGTTTD